jgi:ubiquitin C-terminal hydrolase
LYSLSPSILATQDSISQKLIENTQFILYSLQASSNLSVDTKRLIDVIGVDSYIQQDPQEFQNLFFSKLEQIAHSSSASRASTSSQNLKSLYAGQEKHIIKCLKCMEERFNVIEFNDLSIPIETSAQVQTNTNSSGANNSNPVAPMKQLEDILQTHLFQNKEILDGDNKCVCENCGVATISERRIEIMKFPPLLCLHLMRYIYNRNTANKVKTRTPLYFPPVIQLPCPSPSGMEEEEGRSSASAVTDETVSQTTNNNNNNNNNMMEYHLVSAVYHLGRSAHGGHYICDIYDWQRKQWIHCDDEIISPLPTDILFPSKTAVTIVEDEEEEENKKEKGDGKESERTSETNEETIDEEKSKGSKKRKRITPTREELNAIDLEYDDNEDEEEDHGSDEESTNDNDETSDYEEEKSSKKKGNNKSAKGKKDKQSVSKGFKTTNSSKKSQAKKSSTAEVICLDDEEDDAKSSQTAAKQPKKTGVGGSKGKSTSKSGKEKTGEDLKDKKEITTAANKAHSLQRQKDVYMLYYMRKDFLENPSLLSKELELSNPVIAQEVHDNSAKFEQEVASYLAKKQLLEKQIQERKSEYEIVSSHLAPKDKNKNEFHLLPVKWLKNWIIGHETTLGFWKQHEKEQKEKEEQKKTVKSEKLIGSDVDNEINLMDVDSDTAEQVHIEKKETNSEVIILDDNTSSSHEANGNGKQKKLTSPIIGNKEKLCIHGFLNVNCIEEMKIISKEAFREIFQAGSSSSSQPSFLLENLDYDLTQNNYRCSLCYEQIIEKRQNILKEIDSLIKIVKELTNVLQEQQKTAKKETVENRKGKEFYYLSTHSFTLLKKYLQRLEKQQLSKTLQSNNNQQQSSSSSSTALKDEKKASNNAGSSSSAANNPVVSPQRLTMDMFVNKGNEENEEGEENDDNVDQSTAFKKNEIEFIRKEIFSKLKQSKKIIKSINLTDETGSFNELERINENILCDDHHNPQLFFEKKCFLIPKSLWESIVKLFSDAIPLKDSSILLPSSLSSLYCPICYEKNQKLLKENDEIKLLKSNEAQDEDLITLWKRKANKKNKFLSIVPEEYKLLKAKYDPTVEEEEVEEGDEEELKKKKKTKSKNTNKTPKKKNSNESNEIEEEDEQENEMMEIIESSLPPKEIEKEFYLIESEWLASWRQYMNQHSSANTSSSSSSKALKAPPLLTNSFLKCEKHGQLLVHYSLLQEFCPEMHYDEIIKQQLQTENGGEVVEYLPRMTDNLPKGELITREQWNKLLYFHYKYHTFQNINSETSSSTKERIKNGKAANSKQEAIEIHSFESMDVDLLEEEMQGEKEVKKEKEEKHLPEPFPVKLIPTTNNNSNGSSSSSAVHSFHDHHWDFLPQPCILCTVDAIHQYSIRQQFYEDHSILCYVIRDPELLLQLVEILQENHSQKKIPSLTEEEMDSLLQQLSVATTASKETDGEIIAEDNGGGSGGGTRRATRSRTNTIRKKYKKSFMLLSATDSIGLMKLKILENFDIPYTATSFYHARDGQIMENQSKKLQDYHFQANDILLIFDSRSQQQQSSNNNEKDGNHHNEDSFMDVDLFNEVIAGGHHHHNKTDSNTPSKNKKGAKHESGFSGTIFSTTNTSTTNSTKTKFEDGKNNNKKNEVIELFNEDSQQSLGFSPEVDRSRSRGLVATATMAAATNKKNLEEDKEDSKKPTATTTNRKRGKPTETEAVPEKRRKRATDNANDRVEEVNEEEEEEDLFTEPKQLIIPPPAPQQTDEEFDELMRRAMEESMKCM